ncbi:hypothetical protein DB30_04442 [Enhygromyxa salina]|uniref:Uncharacterized protein n=1 Tax=Enhygromyxa salina TaxID=215803 RepID=A0A0C1ZFU7_9BACT|nr:hypothetical protein DB30_04442 [Enhygromyxa salina]
MILEELVASMLELPALGFAWLRVESLLDPDQLTARIACGLELVREDHPRLTVRRGEARCESTW